MRKMGTGISPVVGTFYFGLLSVPCYLLAAFVTQQASIEEPVGIKPVAMLLLLGFFGWVC